MTSHLLTSTVLNTGTILKLNTEQELHWESQTSIHFFLLLLSLGSQKDRQNRYQLLCIRHSKKRVKEGHIAEKHISICWSTKLGVFGLLL